jgi:aminoglycoside phosphotransferase
LNDNEQTEDNLFGDLIEGLEDELNTKLLEKRAAFSIASARITGAVYTEAVANGVPAALAQEMATDAWMRFMGIPVPQIIQISSDEEG